jgi:uncharacterized membrane protein (Fun14 family)
VEIPSLETVAPYLQQLSFGAVAGFAAGYALKKVGKVLAIIVGLLFVAVQVLAYYGFVQVNWLAVQDRVNPMLESENLGRLWQGLVNLLTYNVTFAAAFVPGLLFGLKRG